MPRFSLCAAFVDLANPPCVHMNVQYQGAFISRPYRTFINISKITKVLETFSIKQNIYLYEENMCTLWKE